MTNFKLYFNNDEDIRRIRMEKPSWDAFRGKLQQLYPEYSLNMMIKYKDEEGDLITITTSREWDSMVQTSDSAVPIKLFILESGKASPVVPVEEENNEEEEGAQIAEVSEEEATPEPVVTETAPEAPTTGQVPVEKEPEEEQQPQETGQEGEAPKQESPLSVIEADIETFLDTLQRQACAFLNPDQNEALKKAKEFFQGLVPEQNPPIMQELSGVVDSVKRAFSNGYDNLRDLPEFNDLLDMFALGKEQDPKKYVAQNETLEAMGFVDVERNLALLAKYRGNMQRVVDALLAA